MVQNHHIGFTHFERGRPAEALGVAPLAKWRFTAWRCDADIPPAPRPLSRNQFFECCDEVQWECQMRFDMICAANNIEHRLTKPNHPWTNGQVERMNRTIKEATVKRFYYESHDQLRTHLADLHSRL
jgi:transposase InsO family protein